MPETYEADRQSAKADIEAAGCPCKVVNRAAPATFTATGALILTFNILERMSGLVMETDAKFMVPALGNPDPLDPEIYDIVVDDPNPLYASSRGTYQIINPGTFNIGGISIYHEAHVRRR